MIPRTTFPDAVTLLDLAEKASVDESEGYYWALVGKLLGHVGMPIVNGGKLWLLSGHGFTRLSQVATADQVTLPEDMQEPPFVPEVEKPCEYKCRRCMLLEFRNNKREALVWLFNLSVTSWVSTSDLKPLPEAP